MNTENQNIGFKKVWKDEYLKWICAFANTDGGTLYIGVNDNGEVCGIDNFHRLTEDIPNKIRHTMGLVCSVNLLTEGDKKYFEIIVDKYPYPVSYHGKYYKRSGSTLQELDGVELDKMMLDVQGRTWDSVPVPYVTVNDLENDAFRLFRKKAGDSGRLDRQSLEVSNETLIRNLRLFEGKYLTRAAVMAFHPDPEQWVTGGYIKIGYFQNEADILYQDEVHGPLLLQVEKTMDIIYSKYMKALISYDDIYRKETFFFPRAAFRELLLNAVIHKDYLSTTPIQIRIYKDKIRLWNDGALPKEVPLENLYKEHISKPCNPNIANVFFKCGMIESWGRGFEKINNYCRDENAKLPQIDLSLGGVTARCFASDLYLSLEKSPDSQNGSQETEKTREETEKSSQGTKKTREEIEKTREEILHLMGKNPNITIAELSKILSISTKGIEWQLKNMKEKNLIRRVGSTKGGHWEVL